MYPISLPIPMSKNKVNSMVYTMYNNNIILLIRSDETGCTLSIFLKMDLCFPMTVLYQKNIENQITQLYKVYSFYL